jgi:hypothetical protein
MLKHIAYGSFVSVVALTLAACDGGSGASSSTAAPATAKPGATAQATATATGAAEKPVDEALTEYDLSSAGDKWKGYVAKLPRAGAQVMADGVDGARLATNGREDNPFDIAWAPGKGNLADLKKGLEQAGKQGNLKTEFVVDTPEALEYVNTYDGGTKSYHFDIGVKVGSTDFHCYSLPMGVSDEAQFKKHKDACKTLEKK